MIRMSPQAGSVCLRSFNLGIRKIGGAKNEPHKFSTFIICSRIWYILSRFLTFREHVRSGDVGETGDRKIEEMPLTFERSKLFYCFVSYFYFLLCNFK